MDQTWCTSPTCSPVKFTQTIRISLIHRLKNLLCQFHLSKGRGNIENVQIYLLILSSRAVQWMIFSMQRKFSIATLNLSHTHTHIWDLREICAVVHKRACVWRVSHLVHCRTQIAILPLLSEITPHLPPSDPVPKISSPHALISMYSE